MSRSKNKQLPHLCGTCKQSFGSDNAIRMHIRDAHRGRLTVIYQEVSSVDLREKEPSFADRAIAASLDMAMGIPTDDGWLLGEG